MKYQNKREETFQSLSMKKISLAVIIFLFYGIVYADSIKFGVSSVISAGNTVYLYEKLNSYISKKLGKNVELVNKKSYGEMNELIEKAEVDIASVCSGAIAFLKDDSYILLVIPVVNGMPKYQSYFITHIEFEYEDIYSLKGKTITFTDELSFSGTIFPMYFFKQNNIDIQKFFSKIFFTGSHDKSIYLVSKKVVDVAAVDSLIYEHEKIVSPELIKETKVIYKSPYFPIPPIIASVRIEKKMLDSIKEILIGMDKNKEGREILKLLNIDRFVDASGFDYSEVIKISREVENYKTVYPGKL